MGNKIFTKKSEEVIEKWILSGNREGYKKMEGGVYEGYTYIKADMQTGRRIKFDIRLPEEDTIIFECFPGFHVQNIAYMPSIEMYCQAYIQPNYGNVYVDGSKRNVSYRVESGLLENVISESTLDLFEKEAESIFEEYYDDLYSLACGKFLLIKKNRTNSVSEYRGQFNKEKSIISLENYLKKRLNHNVIGKRLDSNNQTLINCSITIVDDKYDVEYRISDDGMMTISCRYGESGFVVPDAYRYVVASYLNRENASNKYSSLRIGNNEGGVTCDICLSLLDGPIGDVTLQFFEGVVVSVMHEIHEKVELLGAGMPCEIKEYMPETNAFMRTLTEHNMCEQLRERICQNGLDSLLDIGNSMEEFELDEIELDENLMELFQDEED